MARSTLGKRTRSSVATEHVEPPLKRSKRLASLAVVYDDENECSFANDENDPDADYEPVVQTPSKLRRVSSHTPLKSPYPVTPTTPRFRDVFATGSPSSPRHAVMSAGKLFKRLTPSSTPVTPSTVQTVYLSGRQLFARGADPGELVGREKEKEQLDAFLARLATDSPGGCLYVSGAPGTGKSALVQRATEQAADGREGAVRHVFINCMSIKSSKGLYDTILQETVPESETEGVDSMAVLQGMFVPKSRKTTPTPTAYLLVLDEIDHILTMGLDSLYKMFDWSLQKSSQLALVGIANALDLTDRHLPRLKAKNIRPELLPFRPYSSAQIKNVITTRLRTLLPATAKPDFVPLMHPAAVELCSRKVASQTGDLRRAFEVCRRVLDLVETDTRQKHEDEARETLLQMTPSRRPLRETENPSCASSSKAPSSSRSLSQLVASSLRALTAETAPRASIGHLNKVTAAAFGNGTTQRLKSLNLQQKAALCALVAKEHRSRAAAAAAAATPSTPVTPSKTGRGASVAAPTVRMLFEAYTTLCTRDAVLHPLSASEFREVIGSLESLGIVQEVDGKTGSLAVRSTGSGAGKKNGFPTGDERRMASCVAEQEVQGVVAGGVGEGILASILGGEALD